MTNQQKAETARNSESGTLIKLESENKAFAQAKDINNKIDQLEGSLGSLNSELESIKSSVEEGLDRLGDKDVDLTSKVADTYKRLGELDKTYKSLSSISSSIDSEIRKLTVDISQLAVQSSADLEKLEATSQVHNSNITRQHEALAVRVDNLVKESNETSTQIQLTIRDVREALLVAEHKLVAEIDSLANSTQRRDEELAAGIQSADAEIESSKARMLKMQKVDEALDQRAAKLELSTGELQEKSRELEVSIGFLDARTNELSDSVRKLNTHTEALQRESDKHTTLIAAIQKNARQMAESLYTLSGTVRRHFQFAAISVALLAIAIGLFYFYQVGENDSFALKSTERAAVVDTHIAGVENDLGTFNAHVNNELVALNTKLTDEVNGLNNKLVDVNQQVQTLDDKAQSLDGRMSYISPLRNFGGDNVIHSEQWLAALPSDKFMIVLANVSNKQELFDIAQRYSHYLTQPLAYVEDAGSFLLVYGQFDNPAVANSVLRRMPFMINGQRPGVLPVSEVQKHISS
jgi:chromosome segregation ATPase